MPFSKGTTGNVPFLISGGRTGQPRDFVVAISGLHSTSYGCYTDSLKNDTWTVVHPMKHDLWQRRNRVFVKELLDYLRANYNVKGIVLHGHSNGTAGVVDFACAYPHMVSGIIIVAAIGIQPWSQLHRLHGIPVALYWGDNDWTNKYCVRLADTLQNHKPWFHRGLIGGGGHCPPQLNLRGSLHHQLHDQIWAMFNASATQAYNASSTQMVYSAGGCNRGHPLRPFMVPNARYYCDICNRLVTYGSQAFSCRRCDFDVCESCNVVQRDRKRPHATVSDAADAELQQVRQAMEASLSEARDRKRPHATVSDAADAELEQVRRATEASLAEATDRCPHAAASDAADAEQEELRRAMEASLLEAVSEEDDPSPWMLSQGAKRKP